MFNLAAEEHLFSECVDSVLFLYVNEPSVIIGCNQAIRNEVNLRLCAERGVKVVRRMSGGGAVYHDGGNLNFCFIHGREEGRSALGAEFLEPVVDVLVGMGFPVTVGSRKDLWLEGRYKITGTASHAGRLRELHHGTLLYDSDLETLELVLRSLEVDPSVKAIGSVRSQVTNLRRFLERQGREAPAVMDFFAEFCGLLQAKTGAVAGVLEARDVAEIERLMVERYGNDAWTLKK